MSGRPIAATEKQISMLRQFAREYCGNEEEREAFSAVLDSIDSLAIDRDKLREALEAARDWILDCVPATGEFILADIEKVLNGETP